MRVLDYSAGFPGAKAIKAAGYAGAVRYIGSPGNRKCATKAELDDFNAHGLGMALVFEQTAGQWRNGYEQGKRDARLAREHADAIGWPQNRPIYMAIDQDVVSEDEFRAMGKYLDGAGEILGRGLTGPYGEYEVCRRSAEWGFPWQWQCRAWSGIAKISHFEGRRLYQYFGHPAGGPNPVIGGVECDVNEVDREDWGQHNYAGGEVQEMGFSHQQVNLPATETISDVAEHDVVFPDLAGALGVTDRWVNIHSPGQPLIDPADPESGRLDANVALAHFVDGDGDIVGEYAPASTTLTHHTNGGSVRVPAAATKLVVQYGSVVGLYVSVSVKTS